MAILYSIQILPQKMRPTGPTRNYAEIFNQTNLVKELCDTPRALSLPGSITAVADRKVGLKVVLRAVREQCFC